MKNDFKNLLKILLSGAMLSFSLVRAEEAVVSAKTDKFPRVIKVLKNSSVYENPVVKSKVLADADAGTVVIARDLSPKGGWVKVEDEDGHQGWIPRNRTNLNETEGPAPESKSAERSTDRSEEKEEPPPPAHTADLSHKSVFLPELVAGSRGGGGRISLLWPLNDPGSPNRLRLFGIEGGFSSAWNPGGPNAGTYEVPVRVRMLAHDKDSFLASGPDLGMVYRMYNSSVGGSIGYSLGYLPDDHEGFITLIRAGFDFAGESHFTLEWSFGWMF